MIRARLSSGAFVLGLDAENLRRLQGGEPIKINLAQLGGTDLIYLMYGDTLADIQAELEKAQGSPLPDPTPLPPEH